MRAGLEVEILLLRDPHAQENGQEGLCHSINFASSFAGGGGRFGCRGVVAVTGAGDEFAFATRGNDVDTNSAEATVTCSI